MKRLFVMLAAVAAITYGTASQACVGKTLVIGCVESPDVKMVARMMSVLITERTGTTVVVKRFGDYAGCYASAAKGEVDIIIDFTGRGYVDVLKKPPVADAGVVFASVKEAYQRELNLVWLEPFGFSDAGVMAPEARSVPAVAAPVVRKETLTKFPALPRVINKLAGKLDDATVRELVKEIGAEMLDKKAEKATRKFLKSKRLI